MRNVHVFFICFLVLAALPATTFAQVTAKLDRNSIAIDETLSLTLTKDSTSLFSGPDLKPVEKDFKVMGQSQSSTTRIINGSKTSTAEWNIVLAPRRIGTLEIPPISIGKEKSNPLTVKVSKATQPKTKADNAPIFIETDVDTNSTYVQSQVILTLRLFWAVDMRIAEPADPQLEDALVRRLNDATYDKMVDGRAYKVFERKYAIFPQKSGSLEVPPIIIEATVPSRQRSRSFFEPFGVTGERIKLRSNPEKIQVLEQPPEFPSTDVWLPAAMILIKDQWNNSSQELTVGESITVTISLTADSLMGEQLPPITLPETEGLKLYQGKAEVDNGISENGVVGIRKESIALIPTQAGTFELPELRIPWWNKQLDKVEYAVLPARKLTVKRAPDADAAAGASIPPAQIAPPQMPETPSQPAASTTSSQAWILLSSLLAVGWLITLYLLVQTLRKVSLLSKGIQHESPEEKSLKEKETFEAVSRTCQANDPAAARKAVMNWLNKFLPDVQIQTFSDVEKLIHAPELLVQLYALDKVLYDQAGSAMQWQGNDLLAEVKKLRTDRKKTKKEKVLLEKLYK